MYIISVDILISTHPEFEGATAPLHPFHHTTMCVKLSYNQRYCTCNMIVHLTIVKIANFACDLTCS